MISIRRALIFLEYKGFGWDFYSKSSLVNFQNDIFSESNVGCSSEKFIVNFFVLKIFSTSDSFRIILFPLLSMWNFFVYCFNSFVVFFRSSGTIV